MSIEVIRFLFAFAICCILWFLIDLIFKKRGK